jgi:hypothetical protein
VQRVVFFCVRIGAQSFRIVVESRRLRREGKRPGRDGYLGDQLGTIPMNESAQVAGGLALLGGDQGPAPECHQPGLEVIVRHHRSTHIYLKGLLERVDEKDDEDDPALQENDDQ